MRGDHGVTTGRRGTTTAHGGPGKDVIRVRDRRADEVACGSKRDTVIAHRCDELSRCEVNPLGWRDGASAGAGAA